MFILAFRSGQADDVFASWDDLLGLIVVPVQAPLMRGAEHFWKKLWNHDGGEEWAAAAKKWVFKGGGKFWVLWLFMLT